MLRGDKVGLRARQEADVPLLHSELYDDVATRSRADPRAAIRAGFTQEGVLRRSAWVNGEFLDETILGRLVTEWSR